MLARPYQNEPREAAQAAYGLGGSGASRLRSHAASQWRARSNLPAPENATTAAGDASFPAVSDNRALIMTSPHFVTLGKSPHHGGGTPVIGPPAPPLSRFDLPSDPRQLKAIARPADAQACYLSRQ